MNQQWAFQDAKARLSELVKKALNDGPQRITVRGEPVVVVISQKEYQALTTPTVSITEFFHQSPLVGIKLDISSDKSPNRDVDL